MKVTNKRPPLERFPVLPASLQFNGKPHQDSGALNQDSVLEDHVDAYAVARSWYSYAVEALPEPHDWKPGHFKPITDPVHQKIPQFTTQLFRNYPARAQSYVAERLEQDGWFDDTGWLIPDWFPTGTFSDGREAVVGGTGRNWAGKSWDEAHNMWREIGEKHHLYISPEYQSELLPDAEKFMKRMNLKPGMLPPNLPDEVAEQDKEYKAYTILAYRDYYNRLSNFTHFYFQSQVQALPKTVKARKHFYQADEYARTARRYDALKEYEHPEALAAWKEIMEEHPDFGRDGDIGRETDEIQAKYLTVYRELNGKQLKQRLAVQAYLGQAMAGASPVPDWLPLVQLARPHLLPDPDLKGPLDDTLARLNPELQAEKQMKQAGAASPDRQRMMEQMRKMQMQMQMRRQQQGGGGASKPAPEQPPLPR
jgi:hypothetical protein